MIAALVGTLAAQAPSVRRNTTLEHRNFIYNATSGRKLQSSADYWQLSGGNCQLTRDGACVSDGSGGSPYSNGEGCYIYPMTPICQSSRSVSICVNQF